MGKNMLSRCVASQMLAGLDMLKDCIDRCPENEWHERHQDYPFSQVVFHTLFDCDYHLSEREEEFMKQSFHKANRDDFGEYEELEERIPQHFPDRSFINQYFEHCKSKIVQTVEAIADTDLIIPNSDIRKNMTKLERYVNLIRHMQHHTAQLGLRLQFLTGIEMNWVSRGYEGP